MLAITAEKQPMAVTTRLNMPPASTGQRILSKAKYLPVWALPDLPESSNRSVGGIVENTEAVRPTRAMQRATRGRGSRAPFGILAGIKVVGLN